MYIVCTSKRFNEGHRSAHILADLPENLHRPHSVGLSPVRTCFILPGGVQREGAAQQFFDAKQRMAREVWVSVGGFRLCYARLVAFFLTNAGYFLGKDPIMTFIIGRLR